MAVLTVEDRILSLYGAVKLNYQTELTEGGVDDIEVLRRCSETFGVVDRRKIRELLEKV